MKVLVTTDCFLPRWDGIARVLHETLPYLAKHHQITVVAPDFGPLPKTAVKVVRFPIGKSTYGDYSPAIVDKKILARLIKEHDIVFNHTMGPIGYHSVKYASKMRKPIVSYIHSIDWELFSKSIKFGSGLVYLATRLIERIMYNRCKMLIVPSSDVAKKMLANRIKTPMRVVRLGVNTEQFKPAADKAKAKRKIGLPVNSIVIGYCGRISREKNLKTLRKAFDRIASDYYNARLLIVGAGIAEEEALFSIPRAKMTGTMSDPSPYYQAMDIFVLPSLTETSSLSTMEAMATGLPVVVTRVGNTRFYVKNKQNGIFFKKKSPRNLARILSMLIRHEGLRESLGSNARKSAVQNFDWMMTAKRMDDALKDAKKR